MEYIYKLLNVLYKDFGVALGANWLAETEHRDGELISQIPWNYCSTPPPFPSHEFAFLDVYKFTCFNNSISRATDSVGVYTLVALSTRTFDIRTFIINFSQIAAISCWGVIPALVLQQHTLFWKRVTTIQHLTMIWVQRSKSSNRYKIPNTREKTNSFLEISMKSKTIDDNEKYPQERY